MNKINIISKTKLQEKIKKAVESLMQIVFYFTPIIWTVDQMSSRATVWILGVSPFFHFVSVVRSPLLGVSPSSSSWRCW
jgi:ABC-type polysaccharide/polyol phosphate export permease